MPSGQTPRSVWLRAWIGAAAIGVANDVLREAIYRRRLGERGANGLSVLTLIAVGPAVIRPPVGGSPRWR